ncbi:DNA translocase FtsK 4TM domain-containing protein [Candidatus Latescibacterota bacterium]
MAEKKDKKGKKVPDSKSRKREIIGILMISISCLLLVGMFTHHPGDWPNSSRTFDEPYNNVTGKFGAITSFWILNLFGYTGYAILAILIVFGIIIFLHRKLSLAIKPSVLILTLGLLLPLLAGLTSDIGAGDTLAVSSFRYGGILGGLLAGFMTTFLGRLGAILVALTAIAIVVVMTTSLKPSTFVDMLLSIVRPLGPVLAAPFKRSPAKKVPKSRRREKADLSREEPAYSDDESPFLTPIEPESPDEVMPLPDINPTIIGYNDTLSDTEKPEESEENADDVEIPDEIPETDDDEDIVVTHDAEYLKSYELPGPDLLDETVENAPSESQDEMLDKAQRIMESLRHFNIETEVRQITPGPIVTRYELTLAPGVKVGRVVGLHDDLAMTLRSKGGIRILAPIPGKAAIGIEVPNKTRSIVFIKEIVESEAFVNADSPLVVAIGKSTSGDPVIADLEKMPHLLIAGSTGSGKSVCINSLIASILMKATPDKVRMIMVDPKVVELSIYNSIPHLLTPVITDPKRASDSLKWAVREMEGRYRKLASLGVRDISQYNTKIAKMAEDAAEEMADDVIDDESGEEVEKRETPEFLPLIMIIIDEFADLMVVASNEIEESIARLAQMARAVGMHLVIATQRPSADVITGLIKANFPSRIAFKVMQASNSRIILDQSGADKLLGLGDMLFLQAGKPEPVRIHGAYISNDECERIAEFVAEQSEGGPVEEYEEMFQSEEVDNGNSLGLRDPSERDVLFFEAARLVVRHQQGSVSLLQRRLKVGYARAARLIDQLELAAVVSPYDGSKAREVLVDDDYIDDMEEGGY